MSKCENPSRVVERRYPERDWKGDKTGGTVIERRYKRPDHLPPAYLAPAGGTPVTTLSSLYSQSIAFSSHSRPNRKSGA